MVISLQLVCGILYYQNQEFWNDLDQAAGEYASQPAKRWEALIDAEKHLITDTGFLNVPLLFSLPLLKLLIAIVTAYSIKLIITLAYSRSISNHRCQ